MADFLAIFSTSILAWLGLALLNAKFKLLDKAGIGKIIPNKYQFMAVLGVGLFITGVGASLLGGLTGASVSSADSTAEEIQSATGTVTVEMLKTVETNASATTNEYVNDAEDMVTLYLPDDEVQDDQYIEYNVTVERALIAEDARITVTCQAPDKSLAGVTEDSIVSYASGEVEFDIADNGGTFGGTHTADDTVEKKLDYAEGTGSRTANIRWKFDESYHDGMTDMDDYYTVSCDANGVNFDLKVFANS